MDYEAIIAGASFAGLAAANALAGKRALLVDSKPIGTGQTSACGTPYGVIEALRLHDSLHQVHTSIVLHTPHNDFTYRLAYRLNLVGQRAMGERRGRSHLVLFAPGDPGATPAGHPPRGVRFLRAGRPAGDRRRSAVAWKGDPLLALLAFLAHFTYLAQQAYFVGLAVTVEWGRS
jgi:hypothetical protein